MSAFITLATPMIDQECLLDALAEFGFLREQIEVHDTPVSLSAYREARGSLKAEVVIRRHHLVSASNDIGFHLTPTGYVALISDYDQERFGAEWLERVNEKYQEHEKSKFARLQEEARKAAEEADRVKAELERRRMEEERRQLVESQRKAVTAKAKEMNYKVKEEREGDVLRLVLVKRIF